MGRRRTISDDEVLSVARAVFREQGHTATTRAIAEAAGISEPVLYQRFGTKDDLFFAAMRPSGPDIVDLLGPADPPDDAHNYLRSTVLKIGQYFADVLPLSMHVMTHPSFDPASLARAIPKSHAVLHDALAERLASLESRRLVITPSVATSARLLVSLAHDWAVRNVLSPGKCERDLKALVDVAWDALRPRDT